MMPFREIELQFLVTRDKIKEIYIGKLGLVNEKRQDMRES